MTRSETLSLCARDLDHEAQGRDNYAEQLAKIGEPDLAAKYRAKADASRGVAADFRKRSLTPAR